jgi:hypothetical protein
MPDVHACVQDGEGTSESIMSVTATIETPLQLHFPNERTKSPCTVCTAVLQDTCMGHSYRDAAFVLWM